MASSFLPRSARGTGAKPDWAKAARNALAITVPVSIGTVSGHLEIGATAALGAYLVAFADDKGGAFWPRVRTMSLCMLWCAAAFVVGALAAPRVWLGVLVVACATLIWGFVSAAGPAASVIASMAATAALFATEGSGADVLALTASLMFGGVFIIGLTVLAIPFASERPAQAQLQAAVRRTREVLRICTTATNAENESARRQARTAIASARSVAERSFGRSDHRTREQFAILRASERFMKRAASERFLTRDLRDIHAAPDPAALAVSERLEAEFDAMLADPPSAESERNDEPELARASFLTRLRPALSPSSDGFAYAVRFTAVAVVGLVLAAISQVPHAGWLTVSSWRALRPTYLVTITRAQQRLGGTILGGILASGVLLVIPEGVPQAIIIGVCSFLCFALRPVNYGYYVVFATLVILTLLALGQPADFETTVVRVVATAIGVGLAVAGARWILPRWSDAKARDRCVAALVADQAYLLAIRAAYEGRYDITEVTETRRASEDANSSAYSVVDQMSVEPTTSRGDLELNRQLVATSAFVRDGLISSVRFIGSNAGSNPAAAAHLTALAEQLRHVAELAQSSTSADEIGIALADLQLEAERCFELTASPRV